MKISITRAKNETDAHTSSAETKPAKKFKNRRHKRVWARLRFTKRRLFVAVGTIALVVAGFVLWALLMPGQRIDAGKYQVVYLTNGQAYFGKLQNTSGEYLVMKSPYTVQTVENKTDDKTTDKPATTALLRVRDQVYGPEDSIAIRTETVSFWQNLRDDSKISTALRAKQQ